MNKKKTILIPVMTISAVLIIVSFFVFTVKNAEWIRYSNQQYLINDTIQAGAHVEQSISDGYTNIAILSELIGESLTSPELDITSYQHLLNDSVFDFVEFADKNGIDHNITGGVSDASDREYYLEGMKGNTGMEIIFNSRATHENLLMFYSPVYYNGEIIGSLVGVYQASDRLTKLIQLNYFGEEAEAYLCDEDGRIFASNQALDVNEEVYITDKEEFGVEASEIISQSYMTHESVAFSIEESQAGGYIMVLPNTGWFLIQVYPANANAQMITTANKIGLALVCVLLLIFAILLFTVYMSHRMQEEAIRKALDATKEANEDKRKQLEILQSIADIYYSMHIFDLINFTLVEYKAQNEVKDVLERNPDNDISLTMHEVIHRTISDPHLEAALEFTELTTLAERMKDKKYIYMDFLGKNVGWIRMNFITISTDENGYPTNVICATQTIDEEKKREEQLIINSNTDELTGCYNRRAYEDDISFYPDVPPEENFVYVGMDINGLKVVNDTLGHDAGDELIVGAVSCMKRCIGNYGKIYRVGGDEFVAMIFADERALENIKMDFEEAQVKWTGKLVESLAISTGYVTKREFPDYTVTELAKIADNRLYEAKAAFYRRKGVDRRGQDFAHKALCNLYTKILKINITDDTYSIVKVDETEKTIEKGYSDKISVWLQEFAKTGQVHKDDIEEYLKMTDIEYISKYFKEGKKSYTITYRRRYNDMYRLVAMDIIPADDYTDDNQYLFLYVKSID